jgi:hypothetical protein
MTKAQIAAVFLAGAGAGAAPGALLNALSTPSAVAATARPTAHAVDLRRSFDGSALHYSVYGNRAQGDGGYVDLGLAKKCAPTEKQQKLLNECMGAAGASCEWW